MPQQDSISVVIKSLIFLPEHNEVLFDEILNSGLLLENEKQWVQYIDKTWRDTGQPPTIPLIEMAFPQVVQFRLFELPALDYESFSVYMRSFFKSRGDRQISQKLMEMSSKIIQEGMSPDVADTVYDILSSSKTKEEYVSPFEDVKRSYMERKTRPSGLKTYIQSIDEEVGGMNEGTLNTILGFVASFKTTFSLNIVYNGIVNDGYNICFISLEMTKQEVLSNLLARHSYDKKFSKFPFLSAKAIRTTSLTEEEEEYYFDEVVKDFDQYKSKLMIFDQTDFTDMSPLEIERAFETADRTLGGLNAFFIDYLQLLKFSGDSRRDEKETMNAYMRFFQGQTINFLHKKRQVTGVVLVQANREGYLRAVRNNGEYDLRAIAEANEVERSSYRVFTCFADESLKLSKEIKIGLIKHRGGANISPPISAFSEPSAYVIGDVPGFDSMMSTSDFASMFDGDTFSAF